MAVSFGVCLYRGLFGIFVFGSSSTSLVYLFYLSLSCLCIYICSTCLCVNDGTCCPINNRTILKVVVDADNITKPLRMTFENYSISSSYTKCVNEELKVEE